MAQGFDLLMAVLIGLSVKVLPLKIAWWWVGDQILEVDASTGVCKYLGRGRYPHG